MGDVLKVMVIHLQNLATQSNSGQSITCHLQKNNNIKYFNWNDFPGVRIQYLKRLYIKILFIQLQKQPMFRTINLCILWDLCCGPFEFGIKQRQIRKPYDWTYVWDHDGNKRLYYNRLFPLWSLTMTQYYGCIVLPLAVMFTLTVILHWLKQTTTTNDINQTCKFKRKNMGFDKCVQFFSICCFILNQIQPVYIDSNSFKTWISWNIAWSLSRELSDKCSA